MKTENILATRAHKVIYRDGDTAVKVFDANFPKTDVLNEALNQARVEETGLDIPKIHSVNVTEDGKWCIVSDYVEGKTLEQIMEEDPANLEKYMKEFVALQLEVHSKRAPLLNKLKDKPSWLFKPSLNYLIFRPFIHTSTFYSVHCIFLLNAKIIN